MPEAEEIAVFVHLVGLAVLAGGMGLELTIITMLRRAKGTQEVGVWAGLGKMMDDFKLMPAAALILVISGGYLVDKVGEEWGEGWILFSLIAVIVASVAGFGVIAPRFKSIAEAASAGPDGPVPAAIAGQINDPLLIASIHGNAMLLVGIIWNMTIRPGALGAILALVLLAAVGVAVAYPAYQQQKA
jgi:uncharacterized membrane protein